MPDANWVEACQVGDLEPEDVQRFDHEGRTYAICRDAAGAWYATEGLCTHERVHLADGLVMDTIIECPKHNGRFDIRTGAALGAPVCVDLQTFSVRVEGNSVLVRVG